MKGIAKPSIYFSAYPLRAVEHKPATSAQSSQSPYLRSILAGSKGKSTSRVRVFPMINPYREKDARPVIINNPISKQLNRVPEDIELTEKQWFHNYE